MSDTGWMDPGTVASAFTGDAVWADPGNAASSDQTYATATVATSDDTEHLYASNFPISIPEGSTIDGVEVQFERDGGNGTDLLDQVIRLVVSGALAGDNKSVGIEWLLGDPDSYEDFGGVADVWGLALTPSIVNATDFGIAVQATYTGPGDFANVDSIQMKVHYSPPDPLPSQAVGGEFFVGDDEMIGF